MALNQNFGGLHRKGELYKKYTDCHVFENLVHEIVHIEQFEVQKTSKSNDNQLSNWYNKNSL